MGSLLKSKKPKATNTVEVPAWLDSQNKSLVSRAVDASNKEYTPYTGNRVADFTPDALNAFQQFRNTQGMYQGDIDAARTGAQQLFGRVGGPSAADVSSLMNPYLQNVLNTAKRNTINDWQAAEQENRRKEAMTGAFGGSRTALAQSQRQKDINQQLQDMETKGLFEGYNQALQRYDQGTDTLKTGIASSIAGAQAGADYTNQDIANLLKIGELQREQGQMEEDFNFEQFDRSQAYPYEQVNFLANILNPMTNAYKGGTSTQSGGGGSKLGQAVGIASSVASLFGFSDERVKENIKKVGELDNGLPVYSYNYKGMPETMIGLLAQEVEKKNPDAVGEIEGIKTVDYDQATKKKFADGGRVEMGAPKQSREQLAKALQQLISAPSNMPQVQSSGGDGGMGGLGGLKDLFSSNGKSSIMDLFGGGGGGQQVFDLDSAQGMSDYLSATKGLADGGRVKKEDISFGDIQITPTSPPQTRMVKEADDNIFTALGKNIYNNTIAPAKEMMPSSVGMDVKDYLINTPASQVMEDLPLDSVRQLIQQGGNMIAQNAYATKAPVDKQADAAKKAGIASKYGAKPQPQQNTSDAQLMDYREQQRLANQRAVHNPGMALPGANTGAMADVPTVNVAELAQPKPVEGQDFMQQLVKEAPKQEAENKYGFKLFGREVNVPLLVAGLTMLGAEGDFGDQLSKGAQAGLDAYKQQRAFAAEDAQAKRQEQADYLEYLKTMAEIDKLKSAGGMTPYQAAYLELRKQDLAERMRANRKREELRSQENNWMGGSDAPVDDEADFSKSMSLEEIEALMNNNQ